MKKKLFYLLLISSCFLSPLSAQTVINLSSMSGDIQITATGWTMGGVAQEASLNPAGYELTGSISTPSFGVMVAPGVTTTLFFNNVSITQTGTQSPLNVTNSNTTIVLRDGTSNSLVKSGSVYPALRKDGLTGTLTITCERALTDPNHRCDATCGELLADATTTAHNGGIASVAAAFAGLQSDNVANPGKYAFANLYVKGGNITARGGVHGPGIGSSCVNGFWSDQKSIAKNLYFSGGIVNAYANMSGAGIGGGHSTQADSIFFSDGAIVFAYGANYSPGIGSGGVDDGNYTSTQGSLADRQKQFNAGNIFISGGNTVVTAIGDGASNTPGIGCGLDKFSRFVGTLGDVISTPDNGWQGYVKYGSSATRFAYSDTLPKTPFAAAEEFGSFLDSMAQLGQQVFYTQIYYGPYKVHNDLDTLAEIGSNDYCYPVGGDTLSAAILNASVNISGHDENGNILASTDFTPANNRMQQAQLDSLNKAIVQNLAGSYPITYTYIYTAPGAPSPDTLTVTSYVLVVDVEKAFDIKSIISKPYKVNRPQTLTPDFDPNFVNSMSEIRWSFDGAEVSGTPQRPTIVWHSTGVKHCFVDMSYTSIDPSTGQTTSSCELHADFRITVLPESVDWFVGPGAPNKVGVNDDEKSDDELYEEGRSWDDPFNLQDALHQASWGDNVIVPEGTYTPTNGNAFVIDCDSVTIIGGFHGWETSVDELVPDASKTIIQGNGNSAVIFDNAAALVNSGQCISSATVLKGFTIQGGEAVNGGGILFAGGASGTVAQCIVKGNIATENGGGIYTTKSACGPIDPIFVNVEISGNRSQNGGGMYNEQSSPKLTNVTIGGNSASISGGGVYNNASDSAKFLNTIVYGNLTNGSPLSDEFVNAGGMPRFSYSIIRGSNGSGDQWNKSYGADGGHNLDKNPVYRRGGYSTDSTLREGNYRIVPQSPAFNTGYNPYIFNVMIDLDGIDRIVDDIVDRGAYEYHYDDGPSLQHEVVINTYDNVTTVPPAGIHYAEAHTDYTVTFYPKDGYSLQYMTITTGSDWQDNQGGMLMTKNPDGTVTVVFQQVSDPLDIKIGGISPTANEAIEGISTMWATDGNLYVQVAKTAQISIYSVSGRVVKQQTVGAGETAIPLESGTYIVTLDNGAKQKVVIK